MILSAARAFCLDGEAISYERYGEGHINETYLVKTTDGRAYILQKINQFVFQNIPALMQNISAVTRHLAKKSSDIHHLLTLVPTLQDQDFYRDAQKDYWRVYRYIPDSVCLQKAESTEDFYQSAVAFGSFQNMLADFPAETLFETIPQFHDTPNRYANLHKAIEADVCGRAKDVQAEIDFALAREAEAPIMVDMLGAGELPLRVTHNDTKLNNVMLDAKTRKALCVIDLETVMPGLAGNDFGDSIRFGANTAVEDETDLSKVQLSMELYRAYVDGFLGACGKRLTPLEKETLPLAAKLMTLECGVRFLTDYLSGDVYFNISREGHNLDRSRTQFKLVADMEKKWQQMCECIG